MKLRTIVPAVAAALAVAVTGTAAARPAATGTTTVRVTARDFSFALSTHTVRAGRVTFAIRNAGQVAHDFAIAGRRSQTISPGRTTRLTVTLRPGRYPYKCTIDSHAELGMKGVLRVRA